MIFHLFADSESRPTEGAARDATSEISLNTEATGESRKIKVTPSSALKVSMPATISIDPMPPAPGTRPGVQRRIVELPEQIGLYWVTWSEDGREESVLVFNGPVMCNDLDFGELPVGKIAACVPFEKSGLTQLVPDPKLHCK